VYARRAGDKELTFDFGSGLIKDNLLMVDRETSSVWSQLDHKAISGPMKDTPMKVVPSIQTTWKFWKKKHADTRVMVVEGKHGSPYRYHDWTPGKKPPKKRATMHNTANLGLGVSLGGESMFLPFSVLDKAELPLKMRIGGQSVVIHYERKALTAWAIDDKGKLLPTVLAYRKGWSNFHPETKTYCKE